MGRYRGGSAKIAVTASSLFGTISGSAVSNVTSTGVITIPLMRQGGYPAHVAAAIEAVASTGGQLMPPVMGAAAFLMAEFLQIPYRDVVIAARCRRCSITSRCSCRPTCSPAAPASRRHRGA